MKPRVALLAIAGGQIAFGVLLYPELLYQRLFFVHLGVIDVPKVVLTVGMMLLSIASGLAMPWWPRAGALLAVPTLLAQAVGGVAFGVQWMAALWPGLYVALGVPGPGMELYTLSFLHHVLPPRIEVDLDRPSIGFAVSLNLLMLLVLAMLAWAALHPNLRPRRAAPLPDPSP